MKARKLIIIMAVSVAVAIAAVSLYEIHVNHEIVRFVKGRIINHLCVVIESGPPPHRFLDLTYTDNGEKILD